MTSDEVLAHFQATYLDHCAGLDINPTLTMGRSTKVGDWKFELFDCPQTRLDDCRMINSWFGTRFTWRHLRPYFRMFSKRTLGELSDLIATQAIVPVIEPARILGRDCLPAGVFHSLRERAAAAGAAFSEIAPSTRLSKLPVHCVSGMSREVCRLHAGTRVPDYFEMEFVSDGLLALLAGVCLFPLAPFATMFAIARPSVVAVVMALIGWVGFLGACWLSNWQQKHVAGWSRSAESLRVRDFCYWVSGALQRRESPAAN